MRWIHGRSGESRRRSLRKEKVPQAYLTYGTFVLKTTIEG